MRATEDAGCSDTKRRPAPSVFRFVTIPSLRISGLFGLIGAGRIGGIDRSQRIVYELFLHFIGRQAKKKGGEAYEFVRPEMLLNPVPQRSNEAQPKAGRGSLEFSFRTKLLPAIRRLGPP